MPATVSSPVGDQDHDGPSARHPARLNVEARRVSHIWGILATAMEINIYHVILFFFFYSFLGWLCEVAYCSYLEKKFQPRGFLTGPYCPIYGFGVLVLLYYLEPLKENAVVLFVVAFLVMSAIEYLVSYILEKIFHTRWWDYSNNKFNINGSVELKASLFWATMSIVIVYVLHPVVQNAAIAIVDATGGWIAVTLAAVMLIDASITIAHLVGLYQLVRKLESELARRRLKHVAQFKDYVADVIATRRTRRLRFGERRLMHAFPFAFSKRLEKIFSLREALLEADARNKSKH